MTPPSVRSCRSCRSCRAPLSATVLDLGSMPLANSLVEPDAPGAEAEFPLRVRLCEACFLVQVDHLVPPEDIFSDYPYLSSYSTSWVEHARGFARQVVERFGLGPRSLVVEPASNDGYMLSGFMALGVPVLGVEPAKNVADLALEAGVPTLARFFGSELAGELASDGIRADLLVANNVVAHVPDVDDFVEGVARLLAPHGVASFEFQHLLSIVRDVQFDCIYHEHFSYFSLVALEPLLARHGLRVFDVEQVPTHGGSLRVFACRTGDDRPTGAGVERVRGLERQAGLATTEAYADFGERVERCLAALRRFFDDARRAGESVVAYGAAAKGITLLNACRATTVDVDYAVDKNPLKQGRLLPGSHIPVHAPERIDETHPDHLLILPWNLEAEIREQMGHVREWGCRFVLPIPEPRTVP